MLKQFRYPSIRQAFFAALFSGILLGVFVVLWLFISTRTALQNNQLDELESRHIQLAQDINLLWKQLGEITSPKEMNRRMAGSGYIVPEDTEFLLPLPTAVISATVTPQGGVR